MQLVNSLQQIDSNLYMDEPLNVVQVGNQVVQGKRMSWPPMSVLEGLVVRTGAHLYEFIST